MKKILTAATALLAIATANAASAADMPLKAPPVAAPAWYDWTGFYVGINGGYSWGRSHTDVTGTTSVPTALAFAMSQNLNGGLGGGQAGYNWQFNRNWLFGLEADIQGTGQRGTADAPTFVFVPGVAAAALPTVTATGTLAQKLPWFATLRARLGVEPTDHWLLYVTGGAAFGEVDSTATATTLTSTGIFLSSASSTNNTLAGWTIGGGAEWVISGPWTMKAEYLYIDLGKFTNTYTFTGLATGGFATATATSHVTDNIFRVGINYRLGGKM